MLIDAILNKEGLIEGLRAGTPLESKTVLRKQRNTMVSLFSLVPFCN